MGRAKPIPESSGSSQFSRYLTVPVPPIIYCMAIGSVYSSALSGMNLAASEMLASAQSVASGNLDNVVQAMMTERLAQVQFAASATLLNAQSQMLGSLLDIAA